MMAVVVFIALFVGALLAMEAVAYLTHKYLMHGPLWFLHRSHHVPHAGWFEWNDVFAVLFATPSILFIHAGVRDGSWMLPVGLGMTGYGLIYFLFHDVVACGSAGCRSGPTSGASSRRTWCTTRRTAVRARSPSGFSTRRRT
jgi:beta-carotene 3-hydroxylase